MFGGVDHWIATADRTGLVRVSTGRDETSVVTVVRDGYWPAWHPSSESLAVSVLDTSVPASTIELYDRTGGHVRTLHAPSGPVAVIAPRVPHYAMWSPRGDVLSFVAPSTDGLGLFLSETDGPVLSQRIMSAQPLFSAFSPDGSRLALHGGDQLAVVDIDGARAPRVVASAAGFRAPAFSPDGALLVFGRVHEGAVRLIVARGDAEQDFGAFAGGLSLAFRPGTNDVAVGVSADPRTGVLDEIWSVDVEAPSARARRLLCRGPVQAFFWSPGGERLATIIPAQTGDGRYFVRVLDASGAVVAQSASFVPSSDMRTMFAFFDQYAKSHALWSRDGRYLAVAGRLAGDEVSQSFGDPAGPYVFTWEAAPSRPLELLRRGEIGFFQPTQ